MCSFHSYKGTCLGTFYLTGKSLGSTFKSMNRKTTFQSNLCTVFPSTQKFHPVQCISANILDVGRSAYGVTLFQQFVNIDRWLSGMSHWLHNTGLASGLVWTQTNGSLKGLGPDCSVGGGKIPVILVNPLHVQMSCVGPICHVQDDIILLWMFVTVLNEASRMSEGNKWHLWFPTVVRTWQVCNFQHPKRQIPCY